MIMVMLSQPTPPVSELEARQLSIMFSQILSKSCFAAMPRRTNSITAWEDWQSQIPRRNAGLAWHKLGGCWFLYQLTVAGNNQELVIVTLFVDHDIGVGRDNLLLGCQLGALLELKVSDRSRQGQVSVHTAKVDEATGSCNSRLLACNPTLRSAKQALGLNQEGGGWRTFVLRLVVKRQGFRPALDAQHASRVAGICLGGCG